MSTVSGLSSSGAAIGYAVGLAVAAKTQDAAKAQGDAAVALLQSAADLQAQVTQDQASKDGDPHRGRLINTVA